MPESETTNPKKAGVFGDEPCIIEVDEEYRHGKPKTTRPFEAEFQRALDLLNEAIYAQRAAKENYNQRQQELKEISKRYYEANRDLPQPELSE